VRRGRVGRLVPRPLQLAFAAVAAGMALSTAATAGGQQPAATPTASPGLVAHGRTLFREGCASCHGLGGKGTTRAPSLIGVGTSAADFYLSTGRMPLARPGIEPERADPIYDRGEIRALTAYVGSLGPGPPPPVVRPERGDIQDGRRLFADSCSGCHQIVGRGGIGTGFSAPPLTKATPRQIGEAIRVGPYLMPAFSSRQLDGHDVDSIARFITTDVRHPANRGGWAIGNIGPIPEGLVAFLLAGGALIVIARIIGERSA
jgi:ubiquinol-cytochrome c reductase cytochrome c subunit